MLYVDSLSDLIANTFEFCNCARPGMAFVPNKEEDIIFSKMRL